MFFAPKYPFGEPIFFWENWFTHGMITLNPIGISLQLASHAKSQAHAMQIVHQMGYLAHASSTMNEVDKYCDVAFVNLFAP
jgi:hypothetical protein